MKFKTLSRAEGFTLPEVIMVVAVMAIVSAMAFPDIVSFFKRQSFEQEKIVQADIVKALDAYSKNRTAQAASGGADDSGDGSTIITVPLGDAPGAYANPQVCAETGWGKQLAGFSNLSAEEICSDVWGEPRIYTVARDMLSYRDGQFDTYYISIFSKGENKADETNKSGGAPWNNADSYGAYQAVGDDHVAKFSDVKLKTELFEETLRRMDRVVEALDRYAQARYNEALLTNEDYNSLKLYYPAEDQDYSNINGGQRPVGVQQPGSWYGTKVKDDVNSASGQNSLATGSGVDAATRKGEMEALMRVIGLPQEFCCNALTGEPFYYYSNPVIKMNDGMGCNRRVEPPYMPPKLTIEALEPDCN